MKMTKKLWEELGFRKIRATWGDAILWVRDRDGTHLTLRPDATLKEVVGYLVKEYAELSFDMGREHECSDPYARQYKTRAPYSEE